MNDEFINREYLESLSFSDLSNLADKYGIDVPDNLDRRFLISEILEIVEEFNNEEDDMQIASDSDVEEFVLPKNYNESQVSCVLCNPAWLFVFWNISENDYKSIKDDGCVLKLRICSMENEVENKPKEAFEVNCSTTSQEQYVLLPQGERFIKVELISVLPTGINVLAFSPIMEIPQVSSLEDNLKLGTESKYSQIVQLSGINEMLMGQYKNHKQYFI
mgnify:FL=1